MFIDFLLCLFVLRWPCAIDRTLNSRTASDALRAEMGDRFLTDHCTGDNSKEQLSCIGNFTFLCTSNFRNTLKISDFNYHSTRICFYGGRAANFRFNKYISVSNSFSFPLGILASFCRFNALNSNPA